MVVRCSLNKTERDFSLTVEECVSLGQRVRRAVPHKNRRTGETLRRPNVAKKIVPDNPVLPGMHIDAVRIRIPARGRVLDDRVLYDAAINATTVRIWIRLDDLLPGISEAYVMEHRGLRAGIENHGMEVHVANREIPDKDSAHI